MAALCDALLENTTLLELHASGHAMTPAAASHIARMLQSNSVLRSLAVGDAAFSDQAVTALAAGLNQNTSLTHLDFEGKVQLHHDAGFVLSW